GYLFGAAWHLAFARRWLRAAEISDAQRARIEKGNGRGPAPFLVSLIAHIVMAGIFAALLAGSGAGVGGGIRLGFMLWIGFVATTLAASYAIAMRSHALILLDAGHWLGVLLIQGAVLGLTAR